MGAQDWARRLFDELIPLPDGTSYNAYLVRGSKKVALIDTVDPTKTGVLLGQLEAVPHIDYLIVQHVEQDHSGAVPAVLARYPDARIITTPKAKDLITSHLHVAEDRITLVEDKETLSLGDRTLEFIHAPWVHWPETMFTYLREDKILFTCDLFGSHLATTKLYPPDRERTYEAAKRYYAEIMMPFRSPIKGHLERLAAYEIAVIAPSHGPIYDDPGFILAAYRKWVLNPPENLVLLPYVSMHGSTATMVEHLIGSLAELKVEVKPFNLTVTDLGQLAIALVDAATLIFGAPTMLGGAHPHIITAAYLANALRPKLAHAAIIGSYGWGGKAVEQVMGLMSSLKVEWLDPVITKGLPTAETRIALDRLANEIAERHKKLETV
jgi:flavorubredoxin